MPQLVVIATAASAPGFRLGGARTREAGDAEDAVTVLAELARGGDAAVVLVHGDLWARMPEGARREWTARDTPLVMPIPDEGGEVAVERGDALRDLLSRAVGYQITFDPEGGT